MAAAPAGPTAPTASPLPSPCKTVTPRTHNKRARLIEKVSGRHHRLVKVKTCKSHFRKMGTTLKAARRTCKARAIVTGASWYGGPGDSMTSGTAGAYGDLSGHPWSFAELGMGRAMGGLKPLSWWYVRGPNGRVKRAQKRDIGGGGGPIGGHARGFDAWHPLAAHLGLLGNGVVTVSRRNCWARTTADRTNG